jgi:hypothetical protein
MFPEPKTDQADTCHRRGASFLAFTAHITSSHCNTIIWSTANISFSDPNLWWVRTVDTCTQFRSSDSNLVRTVRPRIPILLHSASQHAPHRMHQGPPTSSLSQFRCVSTQYQANPTKFRKKNPIKFRGNKSEIFLDRRYHCSAYIDNHSRCPLHAMSTANPARTDDLPLTKQRALQTTVVDYRNCSQSDLNPTEKGVRTH